MVIFIFLLYLYNNYIIYAWVTPFVLVKVLFLITDRPFDGHSEISGVTAQIHLHDGATGMHQCWLQQGLAQRSFQNAMRLFLAKTHIYVTFKTKTFKIALHE